MIIAILPHSLLLPFRFVFSFSASHSFDLFFPISQFPFSFLSSFLFPTVCRPALGPTQPPNQWGPGAKRQRREDDHSPLPNAEVKNAWSYTSTPPCFMAWCLIKHRNNFTSTLLFSFLSTILPSFTLFPSFLSFHSFILLLSILSFLILYFMSHSAILSAPHVKAAAGCFVVLYLAS
jgi:hypothetical protein